MLISIVLSICSFSSPEYFSEQVDLAMASFPAWSRISRATGSAEYSRVVDGATLSIDAYRFPPSRQPIECWKQLVLFNAAYADINLPFSNMPLGVECRRFDRFGPDLYSYHGRGFVHAVIKYRASGTSGHVVWRDGLKSNDLTDLEGIARRVIAAVAGKDSSALSNVTVAGQSLLRRRGADGVALVPLHSWCEARGITLSTNSRLGTASFSRNGHTVIVPLGARAIKLGSQWVDIGDTVALHEGNWYAPLNLLEGT